jgi:beta-lactamase superfamily II metal-dependent hydrolase
MNRQVEMVFWDVQHGHATYIKTPNNRHIAIDLGTGDYSDGNTAFSPLRYLKNNYHVDQLDYVAITHPHLDHIDDILNFDLLSPKVLCRPKELTNEEVMSGVQQKDVEKFQKYCEINNRYSSPVDANSYNNTKNPDNWGGLSIKTFHATGCNHSNFNNFSIVTVLEYAGIKIVIPGDNEGPSYTELMQNSNFVSAIKNSDVLLAPHHGRESGYDNDFINLISPRITIVSDGGHYDYSANTRYSQKSSGWLVHKRNGSTDTRKCLSTNSDGAVTVKFGYREDNLNFLYVVID